MKNKISDLRNHLFETIEGLKDGTMDLDRARAINDTAQVIINSAKVEVDALKITGGTRGSGFLPLTDEALEKPRLVEGGRR